MVRDNNHETNFKLEPVDHKTKVIAIAFGLLPVLITASLLALTWLAYNAEIISAFQVYAFETVLIFIHSAIVLIAIIILRRIERTAFKLDDRTRLRNKLLVIQSLLYGMLPSYIAVFTAAYITLESSF